jgi:toxin CptA
LLIFTLLVHGIALAMIAVLPLSWLARLGLLGLVVGHGAWSVATHWWRRTPWSILEVSLGPEAWELVRRTGEVQPAALLASTYVGQRLIVLNFALAGWRRLSLPLASDSLDAETMRRLRVVLRWLNTSRAERKTPEDRPVLASEPRR